MSFFFALFYHLQKISKLNFVKKNNYLKGANNLNRLKPVL